MPRPTLKIEKIKISVKQADVNIYYVNIITSRRISANYIIKTYDESLARDWAFRTYINEYRLTRKTKMHKRLLDDDDSTIHLNSDEINAIMRIVYKKPKTQ